MESICQTITGLHGNGLMMIYIVMEDSISFREILEYTDGCIWVQAVVVFSTQILSPGDPPSREMYQGLGVFD